MAENRESSSDAGGVVEESKVTRETTLTKEVGNEITGKRAGEMER